MDNVQKIYEALSFADTTSARFYMIRSAVSSYNRLKHSFIGMLVFPINFPHCALVDLLNFAS